MVEVTTAFATVTELRERWPEMPTGADAQAEVLLLDASQFMVDIVPSAQDAPDGTKRRVVCAVVRRSMAADEMTGYSSVTQLAGSFQQMASATNPHGDFYLTKLEKRALGHGKQRAYEVNMLQHLVEEDTA